jgi:hypothetical protein
VSQTYLDTAVFQSGEASSRTQALGLGTKYGGRSKTWRALNDSHRTAKRIHRTAAFQAGSKQMSSSYRTLGAVNRIVKQAARRSQGAVTQPRSIQSRIYEWPQPTKEAHKIVDTGTALTVTSLDKAVQMLATLTVDEGRLSEGDLRMRTARLLRRAAIDQNRASPRVASISLLLSDALLNTPVIEATQERQQALRLGLDMLMDSFVPQEREEELLRALMDSGWEVTAPFDHAEFADLVAQIGD